MQRRHVCHILIKAQYVSALTQNDIAYMLSILYNFIIQIKKNTIFNIFFSQISYIFINILIIKRASTTVEVLNKFELQYVNFFI